MTTVAFVKIIRTEHGLTWVRWIRAKDAVEREAALAFLRRVAGWEW